MKYLFLIIALLLAVASVGIFASFPDVQTDLPVIYWVTDPNPAREEQVLIFHQWLIRNGHGERVELQSPEDVRAFRMRRLTEPIIEAARTANPDGAKMWDGANRYRPVEQIDLPIELVLPATELRLDSANRDTSKKIIQTISGVGSDIMDMGPLRYFVSLGVLTDVTERARELGFDTSRTYQAIVPDLTEVSFNLQTEEYERRQYAFPCNVYVQLLWSNNATFARYGMEPPPRRWTIEEFERIGKELVTRANPPGERHTVFFSSDVDPITLMRSMGLSVYNETLTRCTLDDPRFADTLALLYKWTYEDRLLPSLEDRQSFDTQSGYGGSVLQLFNMGNYAMVRIGRYGLIQFRRFGSMDLSVSEPPHFDFPNTTTGTRCATVYQKSAHPDLALRFLQYLASEDYNMQIVRDADALPPNPKYTDTEAFRRPVDYPNEWGIHEAFSDAARDIAIVNPLSPFVVKRTALRYYFDARGKVMADQASPEEAAADAAAGINAEIDKTLEEQPKLKVRYEEAMQRQKKIDRLREAGQKVPLEWIDNPVLRAYYQYKGWAE